MTVLTLHPDLILLSPYDQSLPHHLVSRVAVDALEPALVMDVRRDARQDTPVLECSPLPFPSVRRGSV